MDEIITTAIEVIALKEHLDQEDLCGQTVEGTGVELPRLHILPFESNYYFVMMESMA